MDSSQYQAVNASFPPPGY